MSGTLASPTGLGTLEEGAMSTGLQAIFLRLHTISLDHHLAEMEADGVTERKYVVGFTAEGAMVYDHELAGNDLWNEGSESGRNAGFQIIPYKISYASDGRIFISTSLAAFKNMNSEMRDNDLGLGNGGYDYTTEDSFGIINKIDLINFEYNKDLAKKVEEFRFNPAAVDLKLAIFKSAGENTFVALKAGATPLGYHSTKFKDFNGKDVQFRGFETAVRYGIELVTQTDGGLRMEAGVDFMHRWSLDDPSSWKSNVNPERQAAFLEYVQGRNAELEEWNEISDAYRQEKLEWEINNGYEESISQASYEVITGIPAPVKNVRAKREAPTPNKSIRHLYVMSPTLKTSWNVNKKGNRPVRLGIGATANIPLGDMISGEMNQNRKYIGNQELVTGKIFLNF